MTRPPRPPRPTARVPAVNPAPRSGHPGGGFTLVEVLVALVVMSVGLLGIAGLFLHGVQAGRTSAFRHHAITLAGDIADRIRANPTGGATYMGRGRDYGCIDGDTGCTPTEMASNDLATLGARAAATLPAGKVAVTYRDNAGIGPGEYRITISWSEPGLAPAPSYAMQFPVNDFSVP